MIGSFDLPVGKIVVEAQGGQCIAYFLSSAEDRFTGHVWLFNLGATPAGSTEQGLMDWSGPRQNLAEFCFPHAIQLPIQESDFDVAFNSSNQTAGIYFRDHLIAILADHWRPGQSSFARKDSPLARVMEREIERPT